MNFEMFYFLGVQVSFLLLIYTTTQDTVFRFSTHNKNLKKLGYTKSAFGYMKFESEDSSFSFAIKYLIALSMGIAGCFFSWVNVAIFLGYRSVAFIKELQTPDKIREYYFLLYNADVDKETLKKSYEAAIKGIAPPPQAEKAS